MTSAILNIAPERSLPRYLQEIRKFAVLTQDEELSLARRWRDTQDIEAVHRLVTAHLRLVAKIAMGYRGYGLPVGELISEGNVGLVRAAKRFDPALGFRLATYAIWWIRAAVQEYVLHSWSLVKMGTTNAQKKLFFNLRHLKSQMQVIDGGDLQPEQVTRIANILDVPETEVINMNRRLATPDLSLNVPLQQDDDGEWQDFLGNESESQETAIAEWEEWSERRPLLAGALKVLDERERHIINERRLKENPTTLRELSQHYQVSPERVRQIEIRAFRKLQKAMKFEIAERARSKRPEPVSA
jgi:RNA polymerase sigma-32 factor